MFWLDVHLFVDRGSKLIKFSLSFKYIFSVIYDESIEKLTILLSVAGFSSHASWIESLMSPDFVSLACGPLDSRPTCQGDYFEGYNIYSFESSPDLSKNPPRPNMFLSILHTNTFTETIGQTFLRASENESDRENLLIHLSFPTNI
jgi:hypothetical protein